MMCFAIVHGRRQDTASPPARRERAWATKRLYVWACTAGLALAGAGAAGCTAGIRWQIGKYEDIQRQAQAANKVTFVYFRSWYLAECGRFEEDVLKNPDVLSETRNMVCVPLDFDYDRPLAEKWKLHAVPAYAVVDLDGNVLVRQEAPITLDTLLNGIRTAKAKAGIPATPNNPWPFSLR